LYEEELLGFTGELLNSPAPFSRWRRRSVKEGGCQILHNLLKNFCACPNAAPTAMAGYF
jgi:hypothetical protein